MSNFFIDSNICVYAFDKTDTHKQKTALDLMGLSPVISSQVIIETYNACSRKLKLPLEVCEENTLFLCDLSHVFPIDAETMRKTIKIKQRYQLSFLDSCIIASALMANSSVLYSEDLHHGLLIEDKLEIINPFI